MSAPIRIAESKRPVAIEKQLGAVVDPLDRLFAHEIPAGDRRRIPLRLVWPAGEAVDRDPIGEGLRAFIIRRANFFDTQNAFWLSPKNHGFHSFTPKHLSLIS
jgi:hypothetical protein